MITKIFKLFSTLSGLIGAVSKQANLIFTKLRDNQRRITHKHKVCIRRTPNLNYRLDISIRGLTSTWPLHKYATPWQLCYNRDKENLFHFTCLWKTSGQNIKWTTVVSRNEKISHALRWIAISCSDSKKERKDFYRRIFFSGYPRARQPIASYLSKNKLFEIFKSYTSPFNLPPATS